MEKPTFKTAFRGYASSEVDDFLQEVATGQVTPLEIYEKTFSSSFWGYDKDQVDRYLDEMMQKLKNNESLATSHFIQSNANWNDGIIK